MMRRTLEIFLLCLLFVAGAGAARETAAPAMQTPADPAILLPLVANGSAVAPVPASVCDGAAPIYDRDVGSLSVIRDAEGRYIVALQDRWDGSQAHVLEHVGSHLEELPDPALAQALHAARGPPTFSPPGPKQGALVLVTNAVPGERRRLYFTQRVQDADPNEGPYVVWCMEF